MQKGTTVTSNMRSLNKVNRYDLLTCPPPAVCVVTTDVKGGQSEGTECYWSDYNWAKPSLSEKTTPRMLTRPAGGGWRTKMLGFVTCLTLAGLQSVGLDLEANLQYQQEISDVGGQTPDLTLFAMRWASVFVGDPMVGSLVRTVSTGIDFEFTPPDTKPEDVPNYVPAEFEDKVSRQFIDELLQGHLVIVPKDRIHEVWGMTAVGCVDKDHSNFQCIRIVNDLSRPLGFSVNECSLIGKYKFASVADAYVYMTPFAYMAKVDYSGAYRSVGFASRMWRYHVWEWKGTVLMDLRLMFGHTTGPGSFTELSQAVVRKVKSQGCPGTIGYIDDIITIAPSKEECMRCHLLVVELSSFLGFKLNPKKVEPPAQQMLYLGIMLNTNTSGHGEVTAMVDTRKVDKLNELCSQLLSNQYIKRTDLDWTVGLMSFCSQVILGSKLFMRHAYSMLKFMQRKRLKKAGASRRLRDDLAFWSELLQAYNGLAVSVVRRVMHTDFFAVDASTSIGMGGYLDGRYFAVTWEEVRQWELTEYAPFRDEASSHINYLEIYVIWYALWLWGDSLRGCEVLIWTDNTTAEANVRDLWGQVTFIPLLKEIWKLLVHYDVRVRPLPIRSKVNVESDALSRQDWVMFAESVGMPKARARALARRDSGAIRELELLVKQKSRKVDDYDDWMLSESVFDGLWAKYGPFDIDAATDVHGSNSYMRPEATWNIIVDACKMNWDEMTVYCNPPYSRILDFLVRFLFCKQRSPMGTAAVFVLPVWDSGPGQGTFWNLVTEHPDVFEVVARYPEGTRLFTAPAQRGLNRRDVGATKWPVVIVRVGPAPLAKFIDLSHWASSPALLA